MIIGIYEISRKCKFIEVESTTVATGPGGMNEWALIKNRFKGILGGGDVCKCSKLYSGDSSMTLSWWLRWESVYNAGDPGSIPGSGRSPGKLNGHPLQYSCLENSMDRGAWHNSLELLSMGSQRIRHNCMTNTQLLTITELLKVMNKYFKCLFSSINM